MSVKKFDQLRDGVVERKFNEWMERMGYPHLSVGDRALVLESYNAGWKDCFSTVVAMLNETVWESELPE